MIIRVYYLFHLTRQDYFHAFPLTCPARKRYTATITMLHDNCRFRETKVLPIRNFPIIRETYNLGVKLELLRPNRSDPLSILFANRC